MSMNVAILGSGNIGSDILCKIERSQHLKCVLFAGRSENSAGLQFAAERGVPVSSGGIDAMMERINDFDLVFDATAADAHVHHVSRLVAHGKQIINLTPAHLGELCVPMLNGDALWQESNINMITCGGQASLPIITAICAVIPKVKYIEVVSSISAKSAGPATRKNLNNYIMTTEEAIRKFTPCDNAKVILNINPAKPEVSMQTAVSMLVDPLDEATMKAIENSINRAVQAVRSYVPGYELIVNPRLDGERLFVMVRVIGMGDYLPAYAGNLDIITSSSVSMAERIALGRRNLYPKAA